MVEDYTLWRSMIDRIWQVARYYLLKMKAPRQRRFSGKRLLPCQCVLCRYRHKTHYAVSRIMPNLMKTALELYSNSALVVGISYRFAFRWLHWSLEIRSRLFD